MLFPAVAPEIASEIQTLYVLRYVLNKDGKETTKYVAQVYIQHFV